MGPRMTSAFTTPGELVLQTAVEAVEPFVFEPHENEEGRVRTIRMATVHRRHAARGGRRRPDARGPSRPLLRVGGIDGAFTRRNGWPPRTSTSIRFRSLTGVPAIRRPGTLPVATVDATARTASNRRTPSRTENRWRGPRNMARSLRRALRGIAYRAPSPFRCPLGAGSVSTGCGAATETRRGALSRRLV